MILFPNLCRFFLLIAFAVWLSGCSNHPRHWGRKDEVFLELEHDSLVNIFNEFRQAVIREELQASRENFVTNKFMLCVHNKGPKDTTGMPVQYFIMEVREKQYRPNPRIGVPVLVVKDTFFLNTVYKDAVPLHMDTTSFATSLATIEQGLIDSGLDSSIVEVVLSRYKRGVFTTRAVHYRNELSTD